ncbi:MAG: tRNA-(ms[2]io[6]A)-hydroxylase [Gammaproteobacteria bacterium]|nr:MAG: tRNA-(ms[2]io[6]A)-hydroxylase [Gammaproteobacteria bacterium]
MTPAAPEAVPVSVPPAIAAFLPVPTPAAWVTRALTELPVLLLDHAACEQKAAATALATLHRYPQHDWLVDRMSRLAREELRHFEQVRALMQRRGVAWRALSASRYAGGLRAELRRTEPGRLVDTLLVGALIEARSCERFALLAPRLPEDVGRFYAGLLASEARHFENYLALARRVADPAEIETRLGQLAVAEAGLITRPDPQFRFHSGLPVAAAAA